jgi:ATP-dependent protease ClpP protease subunit
MSTSSNFRVLTPSVWALSGELNPESILDLLQAKYNTNPDLPLLFLLDSPGGIAESAIGIVHELNPFTNLETRALGLCASAAVDLLLAGTTRTAHIGTRFICHPATYPVEGVTGADALDLAARVEADKLLWSHLYAARTKKRKPAFWLDFFSKERAFDSGEALRLGLITAILS